MSDFNPYITADGSIGLYNKEFGDIYHSAEGALSESLEKFVLPIDYDVLLKHNSIKILDICFGLGYNTKSFLNYLYKNHNKFLKIKNEISNFHAGYYDTIHTDKNNNKKLNRNTVPIYTDKIFDEIYIKAVDNDKIIPFLSPILKSYVNNIKNEYLIQDKKFDKYLTKKTKSKFVIDDIINFSIMAAITHNYPNAYKDNNIKRLISEYKDCFSPKMAGILNLTENFEGINGSFRHLFLNLHNIYYRYISKRYNKAVEYSKIGKIDLELKLEDARQTVMNDNLSYNLIFLDAFTPTKCPCLWSYQFFAELFRLLSEDGMLLTYSTSASVRNAMKEAGFYIGNIYNQNEDKIAGTIAAKDISLIKHTLSEYDLGLLNTRAGIFYRDENLTGQNEALIAAHDFEVLNSNKISTTSYIKQHKKESECMML